MKIILPLVLIIFTSILSEGLCAEEDEFGTDEFLYLAVKVKDQHHVKKLLSEVTEGLESNYSRTSKTYIRNLEKLESAIDFNKRNLEKLESAIDFYKDNDKMVADLTKKRSLLKNTITKSIKGSSRLKNIMTKNSLRFQAKIQSLKALSHLGTAVNIYNVLSACTNALKDQQRGEAEFMKSYFPIAEAIISFEPTAGATVYAKNEIDKAFNLSREIGDEYLNQIYSIRDRFNKQYNTLARIGLEGDREKGNNRLEFFKRERDGMRDEISRILQEIKDSNLLFFGREQAIKEIEAINNGILALDHEDEIQRKQSKFIDRFYKIHQNRESLKLVSYNYKQKSRKIDNELARLESFIVDLKSETHESIRQSSDKKQIRKGNKQNENVAYDELNSKKTKAEKLWNQNYELALKYEKLLKAGKENTDEGQIVRGQLNQTGAEYAALRAEILEQEPGYGSLYDTAGTVAKRTKRTQSSGVAGAAGTEQAKKDIDTTSGHAASRKLNEQIVEADKLYRKTVELADRYAELFKAGKENTTEGRKVRNLLNITGKKYSNLRTEIRKQDPDYGLYGYFQGYNYPTSWTVEKSLEGYRQENSKQFNDTGSIETDALGIINGRSWNELSKSEKVKLGILGRNYKVARGNSKDIVAWGYNVYQLAMKSPAIPEQYDYQADALPIYSGQIASTSEHSGLAGMPNDYSTEVRDETTRLFQDDAQEEIIRQAEERRRLEEERQRLEEQRRREEEQRRREEAANNQSAGDDSSGNSNSTGLATGEGSRMPGFYSRVQNQYSLAPGDGGGINTSNGYMNTTNNYTTAPAIGTNVATNMGASLTITGKYQYTSWGEADGGIPSAPKHLHGIIGIPTPTMPSTGSATYHGAVIGDYYDANGPVPTVGPFPQQTKTVEVNAIGGTATITADFAARSVSGQLNLTHNGGAFADVSFNNLSITSTNDYGGSLSSATVSGGINGNFAGPNAEETGGSFHVQRNDGTGAIGIFHARQ